MKIPKGYILIKEEDYKNLLHQLTLAHQRIEQMSNKIQALESEVKELKQQLNKNSSNSHKPPSSDGYKKSAVKNNREKSNKHQGAQVGHKGSTLEMTDSPDKIEVKRVNTKLKCECGLSLRNSKELGYNRSQVIDLVEQLTQITEYRTELRECSCGKVHTEGVGHFIPIQYGPGIKSLAVYLNQYQFIPFGRTQEMFKDLLGIEISDGCLQQSNDRCYDNLEETEGQIKECIKTEPVIRNDETGMRCEGKLQWVHTNSTQMYTHYSVQEKRGQIAIDDIGILVDYQGTSVHDRYSSYNLYNCKHSYCNAHLLRDLKSIDEDDNMPWAAKMIKVLMKAKAFKEAKELNEKTLRYINNTYNRVVKSGFLAEPIVKPQKIKKRGRQKKSKSLRLLEVFRDAKDRVLRFIYDPLVPFDNNMAERDLRMIKLKQKISGTFRTKKGGQVFCRIRGYISTIRKHGYNIMDALKSAIIGQPMCFEII